MLLSVLKEIPLILDNSSSAFNVRVTILEFVYFSLSFIIIDSSLGGVVSSIMVFNTASAILPARSLTLKYTIFSPSPIGRSNGIEILYGSHALHSFPSILNDISDTLEPISLA